MELWCNQNMKMMKIWQTVLMRDSMHLTHQVSLLNSFQAVCFITGM